MEKSVQKKLLAFWRQLGPGLITGASDDDPSGIATYTQAGARLGYGTLWTALLAFPLMGAIQRMCARIGLVTGKGLVGALKTFYPAPVVWILILVSAPAIVLNIAADIAAMGAVCHLLVPEVNPAFFSVALTAMLLGLMIYLPYRRIAAILKYLCLAMASYLAVPFLVNTDIRQILLSTFLPRISWDRDTLFILVGILGTTISPYLFFWQASMEVEERNHRKKHLLINNRILLSMNTDINTGMFFSGLVMYFIILTAGSVLFPAGITEVQSVKEAAEALRPLAGDGAYLLFSAGIIGTGLLAIPVLCGSLSYMIAEAFNWDEGLDKTFSQAKGFYGVMAVSLVVGLFLSYQEISPIKALLFTAVGYGYTAPVLIAFILILAGNKRIMGEYANSPVATFLGLVTLVLMTGAAAALTLLIFS